MPIHYLGLDMVLVPAPCSIKKKKEKNERNCHGDNIESSSTRHHGKYSQCSAFGIKQSHAERSPENHQVRAHAYLCLNKAQSYFMLPLSVLVCIVDVH